MKIFFLLIVSLLGGWRSQESGIYDLHLESLNGDAIKMSDFRGKKILIDVVAVPNLETGRLTELKSVYEANQDLLAIVVIPVTDFNIEETQINLKAFLIDSLQLPFNIAKSSKGTKSSKEYQDVLLSWLSNKSQNNHFDDDITDEPRMFVVSESGVLFADLKGPIDFSGEFMQKILGRPDVVDDSTATRLFNY